MFKYGQGDVVYKLAIYLLDKWLELVNVQWFVGLQLYNKNADSIKISVIKGFQVCLWVYIVHSRDNISNMSGAFQRMINFKATSSGTTDLLPSPKLLLHFIFSYKDGRTAKHQDSKLMTLFDENCWTNKTKHLFHRLQVNTSVSPVKVIEKNFRTSPWITSPTQTRFWWELSCNMDWIQQYSIILGFQVSQTLP